MVKIVFTGKSAHFTGRVFVLCSFPDVFVNLSQSLVRFYQRRGTPIALTDNINFGDGIINVRVIEPGVLCYFPACQAVPAIRIIFCLAMCQTRHAGRRFAKGKRADDVDVRFVVSASACHILRTCHPH